MDTLPHLTNLDARAPVGTRLPVLASGHVLRRARRTTWTPAKSSSRICTLISVLYLPAVAYSLDCDLVTDPNAWTIDDSFSVTVPTSWASTSSSLPLPFWMPFFYLSGCVVATHVHAASVDCPTLSRSEIRRGTERFTIFFLSAHSGIVTAPLWYTCKALRLIGV
jgi:hypothetical protein